jgi:hypothetical protein
VSNDRERSSRRSNGRQRRRKAVIWWCAVLTLVVLAAFGARPVYHFLKAKRAEQFVNAGDVLVQSGKWNEAAK